MKIVKRFSTLLMAGLFAVIAFLLPTTAMADEPEYVDIDGVKVQTYFNVHTHDELDALLVSDTPLEIDGDADTGATLAVKRSPEMEQMKQAYESGNFIVEQSYCDTFSACLVNTSGKELGYNGASIFVGVWNNINKFYTRAVTAQIRWTAHGSYPTKKLMPWHSFYPSSPLRVTRIWIYN